MNPLRIRLQWAISLKLKPILIFQGYKATSGDKTKLREVPKDDDYQTMMET